MPAIRPDPLGYKLSPARRKFCQLLLADKTRNQTRAYKKAFPRCKKDSSAAAGASRLLEDPEVKRFMRDMMHSVQQDVQEKIQITLERVLEEEARLAFFDPKDLFDEDGRLLPVHQMPEDIRRAVAGLKVRRTNVKRVDNDDDTADVIIDEVIEPKLAEKGKALDRLHKHLGSYKDTGGGAVYVTIQQILADIDGKTRGVLPRDME